MSGIVWLGADVEAFPPLECALTDPPGLLAAGGDLSPERLLAAYRRGIFPWYEEPQPILWWSPDPRTVLFPAELHVSASLRRTLRQRVYTVSVDRCFARVIDSCAEPRRGASGTWIGSAMRTAYCELHRRGHAHSFETWRDGELVGGLYGIAIGRIFFGESMFHHRTDASKVAFAHLLALLERDDYAILDCQMSTTHLASLGAREMDRAAFIRGLSHWTEENCRPGQWPAGHAEHAWKPECLN